MFSRNNTSHQLDDSLFDTEHDLDLVVMFNNARTESDLAYAAGLSRSRMRARRAAINAEAGRGNRRSGGFASTLRRSLARNGL
jgi:hypothetical protein